jgi:hypothetical protein
VVVIHDFYIGHPNFGFDTYGQKRCDAGLVKGIRPELATMMVGNPYGSYPFPCLQVHRRSGLGYVLLRMESRQGNIAEAGYLIEIPVDPTVVLPDWLQLERRYVRGATT